MSDTRERTRRRERRTDAPSVSPRSTARPATPPRSRKNPYEPGKRVERRIAGGAGLVFAAVVLLGLLPCPGASATDHAERPLVVATTSMMEAAVKDVSSGLLDVYRMVPPGSCPGHYDASPRDLARIRSATAVFRHDYQGYLDRKIRRLGSVEKPIYVFETRQPQTIPDGYVDLCAQVSRVLSGIFPQEASRFESNLEKVKATVLERGAAERARLAPLLPVRVVASSLQKDFCEWLGLEVVAEIDAAREMSLKNLGRAIQEARNKDAELVVANLQRGDREAKAVADRLKLPVVMLSNFPGGEDAKSTYLDLLADNVARLLGAVESARSR